MNYEQFIDFVKSPERLNADTTPLLEKLVEEYPFCQTAEILYAYNLNKENNFRFNSQLKTASAYANNRKLLKRLLQQPKLHTAVAEEEVYEIPVADETDPESAAVADPLPKNKARELINMIDQLKNEVQSILSDESSEADPPLIELASQLLMV